MKLGLLGLPDLHGLTAGVDERTQEHEEHEEHQEERPEHKSTHTIQEPFPLPVGPTGPIEFQRERLARIHKKGSWMVVSPTANRAVPIKSPEDERLASSQTTSRGLESTKGSSPQGEEPSPQGEEGDRFEVGSTPLL